MNNLEKFLEVAESYLGYVSRPELQSTFGAQVGYPGFPWSGSFIDVIAREAGVDIPACVYSPSALAEFIYKKRWHSRPKPGDIVFFSFPIDEKFGMPHVGIVYDVSEWSRFGKFTTIEAQVSAGLPKSSTVSEGVHHRVRSRHEILGFGRPSLLSLERKLSEPQVEVRLALLTMKKRTRDIEHVQRALQQTIGLSSFTPGAWDFQTTSGFARWQRKIGYAGTDATGLPELQALARLGRETSLFTVRP